MSVEVDVDFGGDGSHESGEAGCSFGHGGAVTVQAEQAGAGEGVGAGSEPCGFLSACGLAQCSACWRVQEAPGVEKVDGGVTDAT